jgi:hypothetical protein
VLSTKGLVALSLLLLTTPSPTGVVEGTVVCEGTLGAISGVQITVAGFRTITDGAGHFVIRNAPLGVTAVHARHPDYFAASGNAEFTNDAVAPVVVGTFEPANVRITLVPAAAVSGSVFDSEERPMTGAVVGVMRVVQKGGVRAIDVIEAESSGKRGEYRIYPLPPGEYYVGAAPATAAHSTTLYPDTTSLVLARTVRVRPADEVKGIDIYTQR